MRVSQANRRFRDIIFAFRLSFAVCSVVSFVRARFYLFFVDICHLKSDNERVVEIEKSAQ